MEPRARQRPTADQGLGGPQPEALDRHCHTESCPVDGVALGRLPQVLEGILNTLEEVLRCPLDPTVRLEETHLWNLQTEHWGC